MQEDVPEYAVVVSDYIHLNPARAKLLGEGALREYRWSSFPALSGFVRLPEWVDGESLLGWHHWEIGNRKDRRAYWKYLENRAKECPEGDAEELKEVRRGWFLGEESFREMLEEIVEKATGGKKRQSFSGEELRGRDAAEAERLLVRGMEALELEDVQKLAKNDIRKQALTWLIKSRTVVGHEWMAKKLGMGHRSNMTRALTVFQRAETKAVQALKTKMIKCAD